MNVYLPVEVKLRELEGKILLALTAAERGHTVIVGEKKDTINLAKRGKLPQGIVHDKSLTPGGYKIKNYLQLRDHGHLITAQDEESGLLDESYDDFAKRRFSEETVSMVDRVFTWGRHDFNSLKSIYPEHADKIVATGSPRVDFWRREFDSYFKNNDLVPKPYILVVSNFGYPIDQNPFWNRIARLREAGYFERDAEMEKYMYENTAYLYRLLYRFVEMIHQLAEHFPETDIVVRPHPVDSLDAWNKLLKQKNNIIINREKSISGWIRHASVIIHNGCTSALEAAVSGIPRIAYRPIPNELERDIPNNVSKQIFSLDDLKSTLSVILKKKKINDADNGEIATDIVNNRFSSLTDRFAADKIVDEWETIGKLNDLKTSSVEDLLSIDTQKKVKLKKALKNRIIQLRNSLIKRDGNKNSKDGLLYTGHKFPSLSDDELRMIVSNLQNSLNRFRNVQSVRYGKKSFIFYSDN